MTPILQAKNLTVKTEGKVILNDFSLSVMEGTIEALMGPNGSGKSTFAHVIMGNPKFEVVSGQLFFKGIDITELKTEERARLGIFLAFQYPVSIDGVSLINLLYTLRSAQDAIAPFGLEEEVQKTLDSLKLPSEFMDRSLNQGASGGEKKKGEIVQMELLNPSLVILDEVDSGLDVDALKLVADEVSAMKEKGVTFIVITHYPRLLEFLKPDAVYICKNGAIHSKGGYELVDQLEDTGYEGLADAK